MRPPGIAMQLDELEYFLPGLYPSAVLAIEAEPSTLKRMIRRTIPRCDEPLLWLHQRRQMPKDECTLHRKARIQLQA